MDDDNLIAAVRKQPILYDKRSLAYRNIEKREACWQIIADELGKTVAECKKRWTILRQRYSRVRKELNDDSWNGMIKIKASNQLLHIYTMMNYLDNFCVPKSCVDSATSHAKSDDCDEDSFGYDATTSGEYLEHADQYQSDNDDPPMQSVKTERSDLQPDYNHDVPDETHNGGICSIKRRLHDAEFPSEKRRKVKLVENKDDEVTCFMMSFVPTIKRLPLAKQALAKVKIAAMLLNLEFGIEAWPDRNIVGEHHAPIQIIPTQDHST